MSDKDDLVAAEQALEAVVPQVLSRISGDATKIQGYANIVQSLTDQVVADQNAAQGYATALAASQAETQTALASLSISDADKATLKAQVDADQVAAQDLQASLDAANTTIAQLQAGQADLQSVTTGLNTQVNALTAALATA